MTLTLIYAVPALAAPFAWIAGRRSPRAASWISLAASSAVVVLALAAWLGAAGGRIPFTIDERAAWVAPFGISYHLGMDGLSLLLVLLTGLLGAIASAASWHQVHERAGAFHGSLLLLLAGIAGVFLALDLFLFYFFWELMLVPMYFLIGLWGYGDRVKAAIKFFVFTFLGGLFMLAAILGIAIAHWRATGALTFDLPELIGTPLPPGLAFGLMLGFFVGLAVKLPAVPIHSWLPDAHTQAPTAGSVILAGIMLKTGGYGFLRFLVPLFPDAAAQFAPVAMALGVAGILYGALLSYPQSDLKRLVAYTSVSHLGFVLLGVFAGTPLALRGAVMEMIAHGLSTGALFVVAGIVQERCGTRDFSRLGGLWTVAPRLGGFSLFFALASLGLPGLANFVAELLVLLGTFQVSPLAAALGTLGFVVSVIYSLRLVHAAFFGPNREGWKIPDLGAREVAMLGVLAALLIWLGLHPAPVLRASGEPVDAVGRMLRGGGEPATIWRVEAEAGEEGR